MTIVAITTPATNPVKSAIGLGCSNLCPSQSRSNRPIGTMTIAAGRIAICPKAHSKVASATLNRPELRTERVASAIQAPNSTAMKQATRDNPILVGRLVITAKNQSSFKKLTGFQYSINTKKRRPHQAALSFPNLIQTFSPVHAPLLRVQRSRSHRLRGRHHSSQTPCRIPDRTALRQLRP